MKKLALCGLLLVLLAQTAACSGESGNTPTTADTVSASIGQTEAADASSPIPAVQDFGGREINFYLAEEYSLLPVTEEDGEVLNDAIYKRNSMIE